MKHMKLYGYDQCAVPDGDGNIAYVLKARAGAIVYTYRGGIERGVGRRYVDGYSPTTTEGHIIYPWMTKAECRKDAKLLGFRALFVRW
jgi:hypothetical protein